MRTHAAPPLFRRGFVGVLALAAPVAITACSADPVAQPTPPAEANLPAGAASAWDQLAALAAAGQDRHFAATYTLSTADRPARTVTVTRAADGSWRVDIPGGALGGAADVSVARTPDGLFQCGLAQRIDAPSGPTDAPTDAPVGPPDGAAPPVGGPTCVRVADPDGVLPAAADPRVQRPFTDWLDVLTDRRAPLSVSATKAPPGVRGACFAVDSTSASLTAPLEPGVYCFGSDGTLTGARLGLGTLVLAGGPAVAPPTVTLPGPVVPGAPLGMAAPPTPTPTAG
ncbi:MAG TPA: hypothetical protein VF462_08155 [Micromonosporaceae bacterium]